MDNISKKRLILCWNGMKQRCNNKNSPSYKYYGAKGIKVELTYGQLIAIWCRDEADKLSRPSIDRIDPLGDYSTENCRFIELSENIKRRFEDIRYRVSSDSIRLQVRLDEKTKDLLETVAKLKKWTVSTTARWLIEGELELIEKSRPASEIDRIADLSPFTAPKP